MTPSSRMNPRLKRVMCPDWRMCLALCFLLLLVITNVAVFYFLFFEKAPLSYTNLPFPPTHHQVRSGQPVPLAVGRCNTSSHDLNYETTTALLNLDTHQTYLLPRQTVWMEPGCTTITSLINEIPSALSPGRYISFGKAEVQGTIRLHKINWYSGPFEVLGK